MKERKYYKDKLGYVCWIEDNFAHYNGFVSSISKEDKFTVADWEDVRKFEEEEKARKERIQKREEKEKNILSLIGLTQGDFCRFRGVYITDKKKHIIVETRENGVNATSIDAIKKASRYLIGRENDEFDNTYAYYTFVNPTKNKTL